MQMTGTSFQSPIKACLLFFVVQASSRMNKMLESYRNVKAGSCDGTLYIGVSLVASIRNINEMPME